MRRPSDDSKVGARGGRKGINGDSGTGAWKREVLSVLTAGKKASAGRSESRAVFKVGEPRLVSPIARLYAYAVSVPA